MASQQPDAEQNERFSSLALFLVLFLLMGSFLTSYYLKVKRITAVHETIVGMFAGMFIGLILRLDALKPVREMLTFSDTIMLNVLLPPIILASGYEMSQAKFFRNFGTILTFAFFGTLVVWLASVLRLERPHLSLLECLIFGSTLSATDPVTILAIFKTYKVDPQLYSIIFGESILNDAVSIVMFETLNELRGSHLSFTTLFYGAGFFAVVFSVSMVLGVLFGLLCSLLLKHTRLGMYPELESCIVMIVAYVSYFFSNTVEMSGIVSLLFCGITLKHYAFHNMSVRTQRTTKYSFQTLSSLSENFIFIYLGLSLFTGDHLVFRPMLILFTLGAVVLSRYCAVFPIAWALNQLGEWRSRRRQLRAPGLPDTPYNLPRHYQLMLFWAGLRGAVGFALSAGIQGENAYALQTAVLVAVVVSVIVFGGTTAQMLQVLQIDTGVDDDEADSSADEEGDVETQPWIRVPTRPPARYRDQQWSSDPSRSAALPDEHEVLPAWNGSSSALPQAIVAGPGGLRSVSTDDLDDTLDMDAPPEMPRVARDVLDQANVIFRDGQWFQRIDERYLLPMFSNTVANRKHEQRREQMQARRMASREYPVWNESSTSIPAAVPYDREADASPSSAHGGRASPSKNKLH
ncbi:monovalent cation:H+ antiporter, CPA1 (Nhx1) [Malassezia pachydermatis]